MLIEEVEGEVEDGSEKEKTRIKEGREAKKEDNNRVR